MYEGVRFNGVGRIVGDVYAPEGRDATVKVQTMSGQFDLTLLDEKFLNLAKAMKGKLIIMEGELTERQFNVKGGGMAKSLGAVVSKLEAFKG